MLSIAHVRHALEARREDLVGFDVTVAQERTRYDEILTWMEGQDSRSLMGWLAMIPRSGALPTDERVAGQPVIHRFEHHWKNHEDARTWAREVLLGVPTLGVDGSQIAPSHDFSIPVGAVQVGWFENRHTPAQDYVKDIRFEVLPPTELARDQDGTRTFPDLQVSLRRFELECQTLVDYMRRRAGHRPRPVCFFDGSLIISFAAQMRPELQRAYLNAVLTLLDTSEETRVPLVGFVDTSAATDLVSMLRYLCGEADQPRISDSVLLRSRMRWGDRSEAFICARDDRMFERANEELNYYQRVAFLYVKTTSDNPPVRLDLPVWLLEDGLLEDVVNVVRAECVVGTGYPYAIETADAVAVITAADRERFYRIFQDFLAENDVPVRYSRKAFSKRGRR
ncbi:MAG TPA: DNA double-strand break repair nuclease NurA [Chloroflexi bacterium]|jgi:hypothetical protein|nr:DNA double-strand break repair nuclease NurA [Chloroflexota bacterium]